MAEILALVADGMPDAGTVGAYGGVGGLALLLYQLSGLVRRADRFLEALTAHVTAQAEAREQEKEHRKAEAEHWRREEDAFARMGAPRPVAEHHTGPQGIPLGQ